MRIRAPVTRTVRNMEAFFKRVLQSVLLTIIAGKSDATPEEAQAAIKGFIAEAVADGTIAIKAVVDDIADQVPKQLDSIEKNALTNLDSMDGKMGNLQEQMTAMPGEMITGVIDGVVKGIANAPGEILGGLFGQQ